MEYESKKIKEDEKYEVTKKNKKFEMQTKSE